MRISKLRFLVLIAAVLGFTLPWSWSTVYAATPAAGQPATSTAKPAAKVKLSASEKYFHRVTVYLKPVTLTPAESTAVKALETAAAPIIDGADIDAAKQAKTALHKAVIAALSTDQQATLKIAHARKSKSKSKPAEPTAGE